MAKVIMVQGTMSGAGKSLLTAGLLAVFRQDGYRVAPFKSQNMALNSFITKDGLEMGRAQVMQAQAAGIEPDVCMNPILLKPTGNFGSQVIVNGEVLGNMSAKDYFAYKVNLVDDIKKAFRKLNDMVDIIVIEGAGSPAEINLKENDIVNMGVAKMFNAPVLLAGDIDRGGVFAQLLGTLMLLTEEEKQRVKGLVINKFRGDKTILDPGIEMIEQMGGKPVVGVVPFMDISIDDEDSQSELLTDKEEELIDIAVIKLPRISNFTDFSAFECMKDVSVRYITKVSQIRNADMIIIPGSKNTIQDMIWLRESGLADAIKEFSEHSPVFGICGGYQMLGKSITDSLGVECKGQTDGLGLLDMTTTLLNIKTRKQISTRFGKVEGIFSELSEMNVTGYEIHMGDTKTDEKKLLEQGGSFNSNVYGSYVHGIFDEDGIASVIVRALAKKKNVTISGEIMNDYNKFKTSQYDILADNIRKYMDMKMIYEMFNEADV